MQYKGEDLDLRVPARQGREPVGEYETPANGRWPRPHWSAPHEPIWVDEIVLQCCNYAFDIAVAHAAPEVGLEHLVHALTRVDAAARVLEARGVREGQLRRESAALLASEIPTTQLGDRSAPRRSPDMEDVLRRATEVAGRRGLAASVEDVLWTILNYGRDVPAVNLLRRMTPDWQRPEWGRGREAPASDAQRAGPAAQDGLSGRIAVIEDGIRAVLSEMAMERKAAAQRLAALEDGMRALHADWASERRHGMVPRIAAIEDGVRAVHAEIGGERKAVAELIRDIQRDVVSQRSDQAAFRGDLGQRLETLERSLQVRSDAGRLPAQMAERMQALEKAVHAGLGEGARNWAALGQRLQALEAAVQTRAEASGLPATLLQRLTELEGALEARVRDIARLPDGIGERIASIERVISAGAGEGGRNWALLSERIGDIETLLKSRTNDGPVGDTDSFVERLGGLELAVRSGFGEAMRATGELKDRIARIEQSARHGPVATSDEAFLILDDRLGNLERTLDERLRQGEGTASEVVDRLRAIDARMAGVGIGDAAHGATQPAELAALLRDTAKRLADLEAAAGSGSGTSEEAQRVRDRALQDMHETVVRLAENQHTLASAIADWRHEVHADFGTVNAQIERLTTVAPPAASPPALQPRAVAPEMPAIVRSPRLEPQSAANDDPAAAHAATPLGMTELEPAQRRGFWYWLFGTARVSDANREAGMRFERLQQQLRDARERRRGEV